MKNIFRPILFTAFLAFPIAGPAPLWAADFVRGDNNGDGVVTISDVQKITSFLFGPFTGWLDCPGAADANDDGKIDLSDSVCILSFLFLGVPEIPSPYPDPGPDPTENLPGYYVGCDRYGGGTPLEDPAAKLEVPGAVAAGGEDVKAVITLVLSNSDTIGALSGKIQVLSGLVKAVDGKLKDLISEKRRDFNSVRLLDDGTIHFALFTDLAFDLLNDDPPSWIPPGLDVPAFEITAYLAKGTMAGEYPLVLQDVELSDTVSGRAIYPILVSGTLSVLSDVTGEEEPPPPPPPPPPEEMDAIYRIGNGSGFPGGEVILPFYIRSNAPVQGYAFSVDYDEEVLEAISIEIVWKRPDEKKYWFTLSFFDNANENPGSAGVDEGYLGGGMVFEAEEYVVMPEDTDNLALNFHFRIRPETDASSTEVRFLDGATGPGQPVYNVLTAYGESITPEMMNSFIFLNGRIIVNPEITVFVRGDSNGDGTIDMSDPITTLSFLYQGGVPPYCFDAADFNDDGLIDIADPIATLYFLFMGGKPPPEPFQMAGKDPTEDSLGCLVRR